VVEIENEMCVVLNYEKDNKLGKIVDKDEGI